MAHFCLAIIQKKKSFVKGNPNYFLDANNYKIPRSEKLV